MNTATREDLLFPLLSDVALFDAFSGEQLRFLAAECFARQACKGAVIFEKGAVLGGFFAVREGRVKLAVLAPDGGERVVQIALAGDSIGESLGLVDRPSPVYAQALCSSSLLFFRAERVRAAALRWPSLGALLLEQACIRVNELYRDLEASCLQTARQRVAGYLLRSLTCGAQSSHRLAESAVLPAGKAVVASRLNLTPEAFSRELRHLTDEGVISVERCTVQVHQLERLRAAASGD